MAALDNLSRTLRQALARLGAAVRAVRPSSADPVEQPQVAVAGPPVDSFEGFAEDLAAEVGDAVDMALGTGEPQITHAASDDAGPQQLFADIASTYSQPIKDFMFELRRGIASSEWIEICMPVLGSVIHGAQSLGLDEATERMVQFRDALAEAESLDGRPFDGQCRDLILGRYDALLEVLPSTFDLGEENQRESIIIHSLLRQIPEVGHVTLEKMYGAGLTSLQALFLANAGDMSVTTGIPEWLCERICNKLYEHRTQLEGDSPESSKVDQRTRLAQMVHELKQHQDAFQRTATDENAGPDASLQKRDCLRRRQSCALQINVLLAEMGEVGLVDELRKLAIERRIERLEQHLGSDVVIETAPPLAGVGTTSGIGKDR